MKLSELITISDSYTDEVLTSTKGILYANEVVAKINSKYGLDLPFFENATDDWTFLDPDTDLAVAVLPPTWMRRLFVPWMNYSVKMNDSSLNEAAEYKSEFFEAMMDFGENYLNILDEYFLTGDMNGVYTINTTGAVDPGWYYNRGGNGGL